MMHRTTSLKIQDTLSLESTLQTAVVHLSTITISMMLC